MLARAPGIIKFYATGAWVGPWGAKAEAMLMDGWMNGLID